MKSRRGYASFTNVDAFVAAIVAEKLATLRELQEYYSYADALDFIEILSVKSYNHWWAGESEKRETARNR